MRTEKHRALKASLQETQARTLLLENRREHSEHIETRRMQPEGSLEETKRQPSRNLQDTHRGWTEQQLHRGHSEEAHRGHSETQRDSAQQQHRGHSEDTDSEDTQRTLRGDSDTHRGNSEQQLHTRNRSCNTAASPTSQHMTLQGSLAETLRMKLQGTLFEETRRSTLGEPPLPAWHRQHLEHIKTLRMLTAKHRCCFTAALLLLYCCFTAAWSTSKR
jgi:hypothetical protein